MSSPANNQDRVRLSIEDDIARVKLARPERHNGVDFPMLAAMLSVQKQVRKRRDLRAVVIHGEGPSFCAGLDFKSAFAKPFKAGLMMSQLLWPFRNHFQQWSLGWRDLGVPVIASIHGNCFGAGIQLALGADFRYATSDARISIMEAKWGLVPDMGGAVLLPELLPIDVAKDLVFTGRIISGSEAKAINLVTQVADDPLAAALACAQEMRAHSPDALAAGKHLLHATYSGGAYAAERAERLWQRKLMGRANFNIAQQRNGKEPRDIPWRERRVG